MAARAAIRGGLDYDLALSLSDLYLQKFEKLTKYSEMQRLIYNMYLAYAKHVKWIRKLSSGHPLVKRALYYINENLYLELSVNKIAKDLKTNRSVLSRIFKEDTSKNLTAYINEVKIDEAKRLLRYTDSSIVSISSILSFSSQSYFQTVFKKLIGMTPMEYRDMGRMD